MPGISVQRAGGGANKDLSNLTSTAVLDIIFLNAHDRIYTTERGVVTDSFGNIYTASG